MNGTGITKREQRQAKARAMSRRKVSKATSDIGGRLPVQKAFANVKGLVPQLLGLGYIDKAEAKGLTLAVALLEREVVCQK